MSDTADTPAEERSLAEDLLGMATDHLRHTESGGMVTSAYFIAEYVTPDGEQRWMYAGLPDQRLTQTMGLLHWGMQVADFELACHLGADVEED